MVIKVRNRSRFSLARIETNQKIWENASARMNISSRKYINICFSGEPVIGQVSNTGEKFPRGCEEKVTQFLS
jgi:hypothetical protein